MQRNVKLPTYDVNTQEYAAVRQCFVEKIASRSLVVSIDILVLAAKIAK